MGPVTQPWKAAENLPASEPATTMWIFCSSANFETKPLKCASLILAAMAKGMPAPEISLATIPRKGRAVTAWMRARSLAVD